MDGAIPEVDQFFRMAQRKCAASADVACIGGGGGVAALHSLAHRAIRDGAGPSAVAHGLEFSVPSGSGHPDFNLDVAVTRWFQRGGDAAEGRHILESGFH